jgi:hypothetical protein
MFKDAAPYIGSAEDSRGTRRQFPTARRIWVAILSDALAIRYRGLRKGRMGKLSAIWRSDAAKAANQPTIDLE